MLNTLNQKLKSNFFKYSSYLVIILPPLFVSGPFIPDLILSIISILFLFYIIGNRKYSFFYKNKFFLFCFSFYLLCILSSLLSDYIYFSLKSSLFHIRFVIFSLFFYFLLEKNRKILLYIFYSIFLTFIILIFDGFFQYTFGKNIIGIPIAGPRLTSFFGNEMIYGSYLSRLFPLLIGLYYFYINSFSNKFKYFFWTICFLNIFAVFMSGERAAYLYVALFILFFGFMTFRKLKDLVLIGMSIIVIPLILISFSPSVKDRMIGDTYKQIGLSEGKIYAFSEMHQGHYLVALDLFKKNPILGVGPKNFRQHCYNNAMYSYKPYICATHPHNTYVQLLAETGIIGFFIITMLFFFIIYLSLKHLYLFHFKKENLLSKAQISILGCFVITLWPIVPSGNFFTNYLNLVYFYPVGIWLYLYRYKL